MRSEFLLFIAEANYNIQFAVRRAQTWILILQEREIMHAIPRWVNAFVVTLCSDETAAHRKRGKKEYQQIEETKTANCLRQNDIIIMSSMESECMPCSV